LGPMDERPGFESQETSSERAIRLAYNEAWYRDLNERKSQVMESGLTAAGFRCECGSKTCGVRLRLSKTEWDETRAKPNRFAVAPGHVIYDVEVVVKEYPHFWLIEKKGEAGDIAKKLA
jgi:hypothetical protein